MVPITPELGSSGREFVFDGLLAAMQVGVVARARDDQHPPVDVDHVDVVTIPGPETVVPVAEQTHPIWTAMETSFDAHGSERLALVAHADCAANPSSALVQRVQLHLAVRALQERYPHHEVMGVFIDPARVRSMTLLGADAEVELDALLRARGALCT